MEGQKESRKEILPGVKIVTWNINGLRSFNDFPQVLRDLDADILCFQETKVTRDQLPEPLAIVPGFSSYYTFTRNGSGAYSGVATYARASCTPTDAEEGITGYLCKNGSSIGGTSLLHKEFTQEELKSLDGEGRCVITKYKISSENKQDLIIINVYCPRADPEREDRKKFKLQFYKALDIRANSLTEEGNHVIVLGDINTSHREIDHCDPYDEFHDHPGRRFLTHFLIKDTDYGGVESTSSEKNKDDSADNTTGENDSDDTTDSEAWQCECVTIKEHQFVDTFRIFHGSREQAFTCWNTKMNCRSTNYGTRIDYIFVNQALKSLVSNCDIHPEVVGSDHCPVAAELQVKLDPASRPPPAATKYFPEFQGRQLSIKDMLAAKSNNTTAAVSSNKRSCNTAVTAALQQPAAKKPRPTKITSFFARKQDLNVNVDKQVELKVEVQETDSTDCSKVAEFVERKLTASQESKTAWSKLFQPPKPAPLCSGHQEECVKRKVTKKGQNQGREFYCCARGEGRADDPKARCNFFKWAKNK